VEAEFARVGESCVDCEEIGERSSVRGGCLEARVRGRIIFSDFSANFLVLLCTTTYY